MTSKLTRERIELIANFHRAMTIPPSHDEIEELARIALAAMDSEPVAEVVSIYGDPEGFGEREIRPLVGIQQMPYGTKLYRHAQPAKGLELAGWQFKSVNGDWLGLIDEHGKNQAVRDGYEVREVFAMADGVNERDQVRREHAEWSQATFGNVGPVGPLKHLSKEALEAAAEPDDLSEWADMQFLLWDAQRRAGITDEQIALAMVEKLAVNKKREWPEPKDGEPRLHIKEQSAPVIPDGWISCSERMPEDEQEVIVHNKLGYRYVSYFDEHSGLFFDMRGGNQMNCIEHILVTHWMPLPAAPEPEQS